MIASRIAAAVLASLFAVSGGAGCKKKGGSSDSEFGPDCETEFDKNTQPDKYVQCKGCEKQHRGMGTMEKDCKNAIAKPWK